MNDEEKGKYSDKDIPSRDPRTVHRYVRVPGSVRARTSVSMCMYVRSNAVSYTHLTLPTTAEV